MVQLSLSFYLAVTIVVVVNLVPVVLQSSGGGLHNGGDGYIVHLSLSLSLYLAAAVASIMAAAVAVVESGDWSTEG